MIYYGHSWAVCQIRFFDGWSPVHYDEDRRATQLGAYIKHIRGQLFQAVHSGTAVRLPLLQCLMYDSVSNGWVWQWTIWIKIKTGHKCIHVTDDWFIVLPDKTARFCWTLIIRTIFIVTLWFYFWLKSTFFCNQTVCLQL